jgi:hypothetical protein
VKRFEIRTGSFAATDEQHRGEQEAGWTGHSFHGFPSWFVKTRPNAHQALPQPILSPMRLTNGSPITAPSKTLDAKRDVGLGVA